MSRKEEVRPAFVEYDAEDESLDVIVLMGDRAGKSQFINKLAGKEVSHGKPPMNVRMSVRTRCSVPETKI